MNAVFAGRRFVLDGSNLTFFHGIHYPQLRYVLAVQDYVLQRGGDCHSYFDANVGHVLNAHAPDDLPVFEQLINAPDRPARWSVVASGTPADIAILADAKAHRCEVVSNDKFRDRAKSNRWIWKRRHAFVRLDEKLVSPGLDASIALLPTAADYLTPPHPTSVGP